MIYQQAFFERTAEREPGRIAIDDHGQRVEYGTLEARANRLAHLLIELGGGPNERVCVFTQKTADLYAGVLGTLKSGGAWVPLNPAYPVERLRCLLEILDPRAVIVDAATAPLALELRSLSKRRFALVMENGEAPAAPGCHGRGDLAARRDDRPRRSEASPADLAYIIFTSGSTGTPKGVMVEHRNTTQFLSLCDEFFQIEAGSRFAHFSEATFDPSVFEMFHCWATAGALVPSNRTAYRADPHAFLAGQDIQVLFCVPSVLASVRHAGRLGDARLHSIRHLLLTGEAPSPQLVSSWQAAHPECTVYNMYGTTETAIVSHWYKIPRDRDPESPIPLGRPIPGTRVFLMAGERPAPAGEPGESLVYGSQLSPGYWGDQFQTDVAFTRNPLEPRLPQTVYRTGDLLREGADGLHYYVGRTDGQIKVGGNRVELREVENVLMGHERVSEVAVLPVSAPDPGLDSRLVAFVSLFQDLSQDELGRFAAERLPPYMVPKIVLVGDQMPYSQNGKIDRLALRKQALLELERLGDRG